MQAPFPNHVSTTQYQAKGGVSPFPPQSETPPGFLEARYHGCARCNRPPCRKGGTSGLPPGLSLDRRLRGRLEGASVFALGLAAHGWQKHRDRDRTKYLLIVRLVGCS
jgi:hypothetical protein